jgi:hypothetical protein
MFEMNEHVTAEEIVAAMPTFEFAACGIETLRFVQLLVEGHFHDIQEILRDQPSATSSVDILSEVLTVCQAIIRVGVHDSNHAIALQCMETLTELCQGPCPSNQSALIISPLPSICNHIITYSKVHFTS